jgi:hypothetical protein
MPVFSQIEFCFSPWGAKLNPTTMQNVAVKSTLFGGIGLIGDINLLICPAMRKFRQPQS